MFQSGNESGPILYFKYHGTNCFFVRSSTNQKLLAIDAGWPGTLYEYARQMKSIGCKLEDVAWTIVTHFHMDHAGLISDFVLRGIRCFIFETQLGAIDAMERTIEKNDENYRRIDKSKLESIGTEDSTRILQDLGIKGKVIVTDYHSADSVSFITGEGEAIVGDLPPIGQMMPDDHRLRETWQKVRTMGGKRIFPSHAGFFELQSP